MRKASAVFALAVTIAAGAARTDACSMCRCGDPTFNLVGSQVFAAQAWHLGLDGERYAKDQASEASPDVLEQEVENRYTFSASRSLGRFLVVGRLPVSHRTITTGDERGEQTGLSNPEVLAQYQLLAPRRGSWVALSLGLVTPWGLSDGQQDGQRAEEHLQPSTGATTLSPGASFAHVLGRARAVSLYGSVFGRINGRNQAGYHYGDAVLANLGVERSLTDRVNVVLESNFRHAAGTSREWGEEDPNTGGTMVYVTPRVLVRLQDALWLRIGVQLPLVKDLYGSQQEKVNFQSGLTVRF